MTTAQMNPSCITPQPQIEEYLEQKKKGGSFKEWVFQFHEGMSNSPKKDQSYLMTRMFKNKLLPQMRIIQKKSHHWAQELENQKKAKLSRNEMINQISHGTMTFYDIKSRKIRKRRHLQLNIDDPLETEQQNQPLKQPFLRENLCSVALEKNLENARQQLEEENTLEPKDLDKIGNLSENVKKCQRTQEL